MNRLDNKVIIITGAAMGLGLAAAKELASQGANLALVDYNEKGLLQAKDDIKNNPISTGYLELNSPVSGG